jgi:hypothetical protein
MSPSVIGGPFPTCVKRSPNNNVPVVSSNMTPASHPCGACSMYRRRMPPMSITWPLDSTRGGRSAMPPTETRQPAIPCVSSAAGAAASHSFIDPHSSASKCPKASQRLAKLGLNSCRSGKRARAFDSKVQKCRVRHAGLTQSSILFAGRNRCRFEYYP